MINLKFIDQTVSAAVVTCCLFFFERAPRNVAQAPNFFPKNFLRQQPWASSVFYFLLIRILAENSNFHDYLRKDQQFISHKVPFSITPLPTPIKMAGNQFQFPKLSPFQWSTFKLIRINIHRNAVN